jgi:hypothetical protein
MANVCAVASPVNTKGARFIVKDKITELDLELDIGTTYKIGIRVHCIAIK